MLEETGSFSFILLIAPRLKAILINGYRWQARGARERARGACCIYRRQRARVPAVWFLSAAPAKCGRSLGIASELQPRTWFDDERAGRRAPPPLSLVHLYNAQTCTHVSQVLLLLLLLQQPPLLLAQVAASGRCGSASSFVVILSLSLSLSLSHQRPPATS